LPLRPLNDQLRVLQMRFSVFLLGLCLASLGAGGASFIMGAGFAQTLGMAAATFVLGQVLYIGLIALMARDETQLLARASAEKALPASAGNSRAANHRAS